LDGTVRTLQVKDENGKNVKPKAKPTICTVWDRKKSRGEEKIQTRVLIGECQFRGKGVTGEEISRGIPRWTETGPKQSDVTPRRERFYFTAEGKGELAIIQLLLYRGRGREKLPRLMDEKPCMMNCTGPKHNLEKGEGSGMVLWF